MVPPTTTRTTAPRARPTGRATLVIAREMKAALRLVAVATTRAAARMSFAKAWPTITSPRPIRRTARNDNRAMLTTGAVTCVHTTRTTRLTAAASPLNREPTRRATAPTTPAAHLSPLAMGLSPARTERDSARPTRARTVNARKTGRATRRRTAATRRPIRPHETAPHPQGNDEASGWILCPHADRVGHIARGRQTGQLSPSPARHLGRRCRSRSFSGCGSGGGGCGATCWTAGRDWWRPDRCSTY